MTAPGGSPAAEHLEPAAFKKLYPKELFQQFFENNVRPDGRSFGLARPVTVGLDIIETAEASALVKVGSTSVLAGVKLEMLDPQEGRAALGRVVVSVRLPPMCNKKAVGRSLGEQATSYAEQVQQLLDKSGAVDLSKLTVPGGKYAWVALLDIYVLDYDGALLNACLLAAVASLANVNGVFDETTPAGGSTEGSRVHARKPDLRETDANLLGIVRKDRVPVGVTCGIYKDRLFVDTTREEEKMMDALITAVVNPDGKLIGCFKPGGRAEVSDVQLQDCFASAVHRHRHVVDILAGAVEASMALDGDEV